MTPHDPITRRADRLIPFVPAPVLEAVAAGGAPPPPGTVRRMRCAVAFTDISGFTAMSEALGAMGTEGTEQLSTLLNEYFGAMLAAADRHGGQVIRFGGDALTVLFREGRPAAMARSAVQCGLDMQSASARFARLDTVAGPFTIALRAGIGFGDLATCVVGDPDTRLDFAVAGPALDGALRAESVARPGQVVAGPGVAAGLGRAETVPAGAAMFAVTRLARRPPDRAATGHRRLGAWAVALRPFLHPAIAERTRAGQGAFVNEHRTATIAFVAIEAGPATAAGAAALSEQVTVMARLLQRFDGHLHQVEVADKGTVCIAVFGAPIAHEDDRRRALGWALELRDALPRARIGITTGRVFCGRVGTSRRCEYSVVGDAMNTAARLMQHARPGQIVTARGIARDPGGFRWTEAADLRLKGKAEPVATRLLVAGRGGARTAQEGGELIGRAAEIRVLRAAVRSAASGRGRVVDVHGEPGIGKTRLAGAARRLAEEHGMRCVQGAAHPYATQPAYVAWRSVVGALLGLPDASPSGRRVTAALDALEPGMGRRAALLAPVLNTAIPDSRLTRSLDPELRAELARSLIVDILRLASARTALAIVLEDCHWLEEPSRLLASQVARAAAGLPLLVVVTRRPEPGVESLADGLRHGRSLRVGPLDAAAAARLARRAGASGPAGEEAAARSGGNPLFAEQLAAYLTEAGETPERIPEGVRGVALARIDRLDETAKSVAKVASVVGRTFDPAAVAAAEPALGGPAPVRSALARLARAGIAERGSFTHALLRDAAYESIPLASRRRLHRRIGDHIAGAGNPDAALEPLAHHYGHGDSAAKARTALLAAGLAAQRAHAGEAALRHLRAVRPLLGGSRRSDVTRRIGQVLQHTGRWDEARTAFEEALAEAGRRPATAAAARDLGHLLSFVESYDDALPWLVRARIAFADLGDRPALATTLEYLTFTHIRRGDLDAAAESGHAQLTAADTLAAESAATESLGVIHWFRGDHRAALRWFRRARTAARRAGDPRAQIHVANDLAGLRWERGEHTAALRHLRESLDAAEAIGYRYAQGVVLGNAGELYRIRGERDPALVCYARALDIGRELGDTSGTASLALSVGIVAAQTRQAAVARRLFDVAARRAAEHGDSQTRCDALRRLAELEATVGRPRRAAAGAAEARRIAAESEADDVLLPATLLELRLQGRRAGERVLKELARLRDEAVNDEARAAINRAIWQVDPAQEAARAAAAGAYQRLEARSRSAEHRAAYTELTGRRLPAPPPLPVLLQDGRPPPVTTLARRLTAA